MAVPPPPPPAPERKAVQMPMGAVEVEEPGTNLTDAWEDPLNFQYSDEEGYSIQTVEESDTERKRRNKDSKNKVHEPVKGRLAGYVLTKLPSEAGKTSWLCARRIEMELSQSDLAKSVRRRAALGVRTPVETYYRLGDSQRQQVDEILADHKKKEKHPNAEWALAQVSFKTKEVGSTRRSIKETVAINVILKREEKAPTEAPPKEEYSQSPAGRGIIVVLTKPKKDKKKKDKDKQKGVTIVDSPVEVMDFEPEPLRPIIHQSRPPGSPYMHTFDGYPPMPSRSRPLSLPIHAPVPPGNPFDQDYPYQKTYYYDAYHHSVPRYLESGGGAGYRDSSMRPVERGAVRWLDSPSSPSSGGPRGTSGSMWSGDGSSASTNTSVESVLPRGGGGSRYSVYREGNSVFVEPAGTRRDASKARRRDGSKERRRDDSKERRASSFRRYFERPKVHYDLPERKSRRSARETDERSAEHGERTEQSNLRKLVADAYQLGLGRRSASRGRAASGHRSKH